MNIFELLAEQRIREALLRGDFDGLPGVGRPLVFDDDVFVSPEHRMASRVFKRAGCTPREILLRREIATLHQEIDAAPAGERRDELKRQLAWLLIQLSEGRSPR